MLVRPSRSTHRILFCSVFTLAALLFSLAQWRGVKLAAAAPLAGTSLSALLPSNWMNNQAAVNVIGQPNFTSNSSGISATTLNTPTGVAVDPTTGKAFVADFGNHRVLRYSSAAAQATGQAAEVVLGQPDFINNTAATTQSGMRNPIDVFVDVAGRLLVAEYENHRVLRFDNATTKANGANADGVLGQHGFITSAGAISQSGMQSPYSFGLTTGSLPNGLTLASGGALTGTPTAAGTFNFTVTATDANGCPGTRVYTVIVSGNGLQFYPLISPVRALETRGKFMGCVNPGAPINAGASFTLAVRTGCTGIPANALAVTGNVTVVPSAAGGYLTLFPSSATQPIIANSNFKPFEVTNNVFTTGLGAGDGAFRIFASAATEVIVDITGYYAPPAANGLYFHALPEPVRLVETRTLPGLTGCIKPGTPLTGGQDFAVQGRSPVAAPCNVIPTAAQVLVGNATSVIPAGAGFLTIFPSDAARPLIASSNYVGADIINGPFAVKLGADGQFKVYTQATTELVIDILGYYSTEATDANGAGLLFNPLDKPVRLLETRADFPGFPPLTGCYRPNAKIPGGTGGIRTQPSWGICEGLTIPTTARALIGNATVVNVDGAGFMTFYPGNVASAPTVATSNYPVPVIFGYNRHFIVGVGPSDGTFKILTQWTTDLIVDVAGYFAP